MPFFLIFVIIPLLELFIFAAVSEHIGLLTALLFALLTAIIGGSVVKFQGLQTLGSMRTSMDRGRIPAAEIFDGFCLVAAGALLITPGFLTDAIGFSLLIPHFRRFLREIIKKHTNFTIETSGFRDQRYQDPDIIEGEYENLDPDQPKSNHKSLP